MPQMVPLPPGLSPVDAARLGLWLLGVRNRRAAARRRGFPTHVYNRNLADRFRGLITPWRVHEYPGTVWLMAEICGVKRESARQWCTGTNRLAPHQSRRLADYLRGHAASEIALAQELEEEARKIEQAAAMKGGPACYLNGIAKWRREKAALNAACSLEGEGGEEHRCTRQNVHTRF